MGKYYRRKKYHKKSHHNKHFHNTKRRHSALSIFFYKFKRFVRRNPVLSAVVSIIISIFLIRISFSNELFGNDVTEFRFWFIFFAIILGLVGLFSLKVWWRNNVSNFNVQANLKWKNR